MADITISEVTDISDPKLKAIALRVALTARLAAEKAVANQVASTKYPITSDPDSLEQLFLERFKTLNKPRREKAVANVMASVEAPQQTRVKVYGDLATVDLKSPTAISAQVKAIALPPQLKFQLSHLQTLTPPSMGLTPQQTTDKLELRIHKVKCVNETGSWLPWPISSTPGVDDIRLGGTTIRADGSTTDNTKPIPAFKVADFNDGDEKTYSPPRRFASFNLTAGTAWPREYFVVLALAEKDHGGFPEFLDELLKKIKEYVITAIGAAVGAGIGGSLAGPIGAAVGAAVGYIVGWLIDYIKGVWMDDMFDPKTLGIHVGHLGGTFPGNQTESSDRTVTFKAHLGEYRLTYDWRLYS